VRPSSRKRSGKVDRAEVMVYRDTLT
jgi:hypothetical protein